MFHPTFFDKKHFFCCFVSATVSHNFLVEWMCISPVISKNSSSLLSPHIHCKYLQIITEIHIETLQSAMSTVSETPQKRIARVACLWFTGFQVIHSEFLHLWWNNLQCLTRCTRRQAFQMMPDSNVYYSKLWANWACNVL